MGDRANVAILQHGGAEDTSRVYLYTHWGGYDLPLAVQAALAKRSRWDDEQYLARIVFEAMVGDQTGGETGFGITTYLGDNERPIIVLDCANQTVSVEADPARPWTGRAPDHGWSFEEFVGLDLKGLSGENPWLRLRVES